jgi:hypothetical protein
LGLLFPRFSLVHRVLLLKVSLALRALRRLSTILAEAIIYDRGFLFEHHRTGFLQSIKDWGGQLGLQELHLVGDRGEVSSQLDAARQVSLNGTWDTFARMPSTGLVASLVGSRAHFHAVALEASRYSQLGLRVFLLAITGSLAQSYLRTRACHSCGVQYSFEHFVTCPSLGVDLLRLLETAVANEDWKGFVRILFGRFQVFSHFHRGGVCEPDESDLFAALDDDSGD